jgi:GH25 family lysozyme M1 (1,4-beta-N-acetylmuramidase)
MMLYGSASSIPHTGAVLLWVAAYNNEGPGVPETALWQFSETGTIEGIANHVDLSHWLGSQEEFKTFFSVK